LVIRLSKNGTIGHSKPCHRCIKELSESHLNIKYVYYSDHNGDIIRENLTYMENTHFTLGYRKSIGLI